MKTISIERTLQFNVYEYPTEGIYHNLLTGEILMVNRKTNFVIFIGTYNDCNHLFQSELKAETSNVQTVTESFALKLAAVLTNSDKLKEYEI